MLGCKLLGGRLAVQNRTYREIFFAINGIGPYTCVFCNRSVSFEQVHIHHVDHDRTNNDGSNLQPSHPRCHNRYHKGGTTHRAEVKERIRQSVRAHVSSLSPEERKKYGSTVWVGRKHTEETRRKISAARSGKPGTPRSQELRDRQRAWALAAKQFCPQDGCDVYSPPGGLARHRKATGH